jgi:hypothetical protein
MPIKNRSVFERIIKLLETRFVFNSFRVQILVKLYPIDIQ